MAYDKLVDSAKLDAALKSTADAIRAKTGGTLNIPWDETEGFKSAVEGITAGGGSEIKNTATGKIANQFLTENVIETVAAEYIAEYEYYNGEQFVKVPRQILDAYPYVVMLRAVNGDARIYASNNKPYVDSTKKLVIPAGGLTVYYFNATSKVWYGNTYTLALSSPSLNNLSYTWGVMWTNFDLPYGSADAAELYLPATEPTAEQPAAAAYCYYNGLRLPAVPADAGFSDWVVLCWPNGSIQAIGSASGLYFSGTTLRDKSSVKLKAYKLTDGAWVEDQNQSEKYTSWTCVSDNVSIVQWSSHNIPSGSATATTYYFYGTYAAQITE